MDIKLKRFKPTVSEDQKIKQFGSEISSNFSEGIDSELEIIKEGGLFFGDIELKKGKRIVDIVASSSKLTTLLGNLKDKLYERLQALSKGKEDIAT